MLGVSLEISPGEFMAVIGQNGSGKTTLVKHFNGLLRPTEGKVWVKGRDTSRTPVSVLAGLVGYVFQNPDHQIFCPTVWAEVSFGPRNLRFPRERIEKNTRRALEVMGLTDKANWHPHTLSRGERQRLAIASVLAVEPEVIVLDEPTGGQDRVRVQTLMSLLLDLNRHGHTIVLVTHDLELAAEYCRRVLVMYRGRVLFDGTPREVFREEKKLSEISLVPPQVCRLSLALGRSEPCLSVAEFVEEVRRHAAAPSVSGSRHG